MSQNTICWTDIPVTQLDRAMAFYSAVLAQPMAREPGPGFEFGLLPHHENNVSGCLSACEHNAPSLTGPLVYFSVNDRLDAAVETAKSLGGKVLEEKHQIGPYGYRAVIVDSEGNRIALHSERA